MHKQRAAMKLPVTLESSPPVAPQTDPQKIAKRGSQEKNPAFAAWDGKGAQTYVLQMSKAAFTALSSQHEVQASRQHFLSAVLPRFH